MTESTQPRNGARRPSQIMAEINRTREEMDQTLHAIEDRLTPGQLVDQGLDYLKHSGARDFVTNLGNSARTNPWPATVAGIGLAWLMATANRSTARDSGVQVPQPLNTGAGSSAPGIGERMQGAKDSMSANMQSAKDRVTSGMQSAREGVTGTMQSARENVSGTMQSARDSLSSGMQSARDTAAQLADSTRMQIDRARSGWDYMIREHPLALGAIGLAIGAVAAALAPRTRTEDEMMGDARERLMDQAKSVGSEKLEQAKQVANAAKETVKSEVQKQAEPPRQAEQPRQQGGGAHQHPGAPQPTGARAGAQPPAGASGPRPPAQPQRGATPNPGSALSGDAMKPPSQGGVRPPRGDSSANPPSIGGTPGGTSGPRRTS